MMDRQTKAAGLAGLAITAAIVAVIVVPGGSPNESGSSSSGSTSAGASSGSSGSGESSARGSTSFRSAVGSVAAPATTQSRNSSSGGATEGVDASLTATRVVRVGQLSMVVPNVATALDRLTSLADGAGGYVQSSDTTTNAGLPQGDITVRVPAGDFEAAVAAAQRLGRTTSLTTSAKDVTGRYVDLVAQATALRRTRTTYLSILSTAKTIGATLSVQQRIEDVQQQLDQLEGERKVLAAQSDDATLSVSLIQHASKTGVRPTHHSSGIGAAWHRSVHRFSVGFDAIVGALGPLLLAVLLMAMLAGIGLLGYRGVRRVVSRSAAEHQQPSSP